MDLTSAAGREPVPAQSRRAGDASLRAIAPAPAPPRGLNNYQVNSPPKRTRIGVRKACEPCRSKKSRCDGIRPQCSPCFRQKSECFYNSDSNQHQAHADLIGLLIRKPEKEAIDLLLRLRSTVDSESASPPAQGPSQPVHTQARIERFKEKHGQDFASNRPAKYMEASDTLIQKLVKESSRHHNLSKSSSLLAAKDGHHRREQGPSSVLSSSASHSQSIGWTHVDLDQDRVHRLFDALFEWDYFPFCLMSRNQFLKDYYSGSTRYCSSLLVNALIALAIRAASDDEEALGTSWLQDADFFDEAKAMVHAGKLNSLPDVQALEPLTGVEEEEWSRVRKTSYCSAVFLTRYE
ncbi:hypothetical protein CDD81_195 [Ophiocordyceps australis]|uniref:Zn(2)-C6 fungal-type domain-containing protein n=1 Tax=Ophiocordyceps australis TaxID=1399860 RepID=A0A2C5YFR1_9HYPO|nr:hypothetical protein CDD81_195 [Ophiocordyceps australis]